MGRKIERLVSLRKKKEPLTAELSAWLDTMDAKFRARLVKYGILDSRWADRSKPLSEHLGDYRRSILNGGRTQEYADQTAGRIRSVFQACGFVYYADISASAVETYLADSRSMKDGIGPKTSNHYLHAAKQFCNWMIKDRRAKESPVAHLSCVNANTDVRRERRELNDEEVTRLLDAARTGDEFRQMSGMQRFMLYASALGTGLRASELASLTVSHFDLDAEIRSLKLWWAKHADGFLQHKSVPEPTITSVNFAS
ncbi:MAG: hypothetical protein IH987_21165 [Planctomycetes bacterium]|nr:hypothetical protein [Planctomycetota bacterium]